MDTTHEYPTDDSAPAKSKPKLFSLAQSHALLESKRLNANTSHLSEPQNILNTRMRMDSGQTQRMVAPPGAPRISLSHLLSNNPAQARTSTPVSAPRSSAQGYNSERRDNDKENINSSPAFSTFDSPDRAYIQQNRPFSAAPNPQHTLRLSALYRSPDITRKSANDTSTQSEPPSSINKQPGNTKEHLMQFFNSTVHENDQLRASNQHFEVMNVQLSRELADYRSNLSVINEQLSSTTLEIKTLRPALTLAREQLSASEIEIASLKAHYSDTKADLETIRAENLVVKEDHIRERLENERLRSNVDTVKNRIAKLLIEYSTLGENFKELKRAYDSQKALHTALVKDAEATQTLAKSGLAALEPMLDDNKTIARSEDTKIVLKELHDDLLASQQVTDLLRNKLHHQSSQLADTQSRIKELEDEKRGSMQELLTARLDAKRECQSLEAVEGRVEKLSARLIEREKESFSALADTAVCKVELKAVKDELERCQKEIEAYSVELASLRKVKDENVSSLLALQDVINTRDKDIIAHKADIKSLNESKSELRALLAENKKNLADAETELRKRDVIVNARDREVVALVGERKALTDSKVELHRLLSETKNTLAEKVAELKKRDPNEDLLLKIRELETRESSLKSALEESQEQYILGERSLKQLEQEFTKKLQDAEKANVELKSIAALLKESSANAQAQVKSAQVEHTESLNEALHSASTERERCSALERAMQRAEEDARKQHQSLQSEIATAKAQTSKMQEQLNAASTKGSNASGKCSILEANIKKAEKESRVAREGFLAEISDLKNRLEAQSINLFQAKEESASLKERVVAGGEQQATLQVALDNAQKRASTAETAVTLMQTQMTEAKQALKQTESKLTSITRELADAQKAARNVKASANLQSDEALKKSEARIAELEKTNADLSSWADELRTRYKDGRLSDKEKEFIAYLMDQAESIHAEDVVRKDNELRRREHTIQTLNTKVAELQASVARFIKTQSSVTDPSSKSIIDLKAWLASSPGQMLSEDNMKDVFDLFPDESKAKPSSRPGADMVYGPDDDTPLSEISRFSEEAEEPISKKRIRPASPIIIEEPAPSKRRTKNSAAAGQRASTSTANTTAPEIKITKSKSKKQRK